MKRQRIARALTVLILAAALGFAVARQKGWGISGWNRLGATMSTFRPTLEPTPQDAVYAMLDAARDGDVKKYLASYTGAMETALRQSIAESSDVAFRKYLQDTN